ncbi:MAG: BON domain-containing protein [Gammaproteobacteria bacterium]|nr:BON domain-containing protein [Gammaproteobacteria bacterium]
MNFKTLLVSAVIGTSSLFFVACAHHDGHERTGREVVTDSTITAQVKAALLAEKDVNSFDINVTVFEGNVQLAGFVNSQWQIDKAIQVAKNVKHVKNVKSDMVIKAK